MTADDGGEKHYHHKVDNVSMKGVMDFKKNKLI